MLGWNGSKMRFLAAPWVGMLEGDAWLRHARHANAMAARLEEHLAELAVTSPEIELPHPREANAVFARLPKPWVKAMHQRGWTFYNFFAGGLSRLMCSWDTTEGDIDTFAADLREVAGMEKEESSTQSHEVTK